MKKIKLQCIRLFTFVIIYSEISVNFKISSVSGGKKTKKKLSVVMNLMKNIYIFKKRRKIYLSYWIDIGDSLPVQPNKKEPKQDGRWEKVIHRVKKIMTFRTERRLKYQTGKLSCALLSFKFKSWGERKTGINTDFSLPNQMKQKNIISGSKN